MTDTERPRRRDAIIVAAVALACAIGSVASAQQLEAPVRGSKVAKNEVEAFVAIATPAGARLGVVLETLHQRHPDTRIVFRHLAPEDDQAPALAHRAALAAARQGKFWEMMRLLLPNEQPLARDAYLVMARQLQLNYVRFAADLDDVAAADAVFDADRARAGERHVTTQPVASERHQGAVFVNGQRVNGELTVAAIEALLPGEQ